MGRKGTNKVLDAFFRREPANGAKCQNPRFSVFGERIISTDGVTLYSYRMPIARWTRGDTLTLVEYGRAPTATTRSHVRETFSEAMRRSVTVERKQAIEVKS